MKLETQLKEAIRKNVLIVAVLSLKLSVARLKIALSILLS